MGNISQEKIDAAKTDATASSSVETKEEAQNRRKRVRIEPKDPNAKKRAVTCSWCGRVGHNAVTCVDKKEGKDKILSKRK